jgi:hypothetical protein
MGKANGKPKMKRQNGHAKVRRKRRGRQESTLEIMERLLTRRVAISVRGEPKRVYVTEAIVLQIMQKAMAGNARAWRAFLRYRDFSNRQSAKALELKFVESDYTRAFASSFPSSDNGSL